MQAFSLSYKFIQRFPVPAQEAFEWATDYQPNDLTLMGEDGKRTIQKITKDTIILKEDIMHRRGRTSKVKLVRLNPRALSWHNIHIRGPNKYSEFLYQITPEGKSRSKLTFILVALDFWRSIRAHIRPLLLQADTDGAE